MFRSNNLWLDGYHTGDKNWKTYSYRELDHNYDPILGQDLSLTRGWFLEEPKTKYRLPLKTVEYPAGFCNNNDQIFTITGKWQANQIAEKPPLVMFHINKTSDLFVWEFKAGNKKENHFYEVFAKTNKVNITNKLVNLTELQRDPIPQDFNLTISCTFPVFDVKLNFWDPADDPNGISRNSQSWDTQLTVDTNVNPDATESMIIDGGMEVLKLFHLHALKLEMFSLLMLDLPKRSVYP